MVWAARAANGLGKLIAPEASAVETAGGRQVELAQNFRDVSKLVGGAGSVQGCADMQSTWQQDAAISEPFVAGGNTTQTITFPSSGPKRFYRVGFPVVWTWP